MKILFICLSLCLVQLVYATGSECTSTPLLCRNASASCSSEGLLTRYADQSISSHSASRCGNWGQGAKYCAKMVTLNSGVQYQDTTYLCCGKNGDALAFTSENAGEFYDRYCTSGSALPKYDDNPAQMMVQRPRP